MLRTMVSLPTVDVDLAAFTRACRSVRRVVVGIFTVSLGYDNRRTNEG
jgi:hypothetical protein